MMRKIKAIIVHCSASKNNIDIGVDEIRRYHMKEKGWSDIGYHYVIRLNGTREKGRCVLKAGAHCVGYNAHTIGVCYVGGLSQSGDKVDTRTEEQKKELNKLLTELVEIYHCPIVGHHFFNKHKECPCFDAYREYLPIYEKITGRTITESEIRALFK